MHSLLRLAANKFWRQNFPPKIGSDSNTPARKAPAQQPQTHVNKIPIPTSMTSTKKPRKTDFFAGTHLPTTSTSQAPLRCICHLDLDCFYAAVETVRLGLDPSTPLAVQQWRGVIAVNYAARSFGVNRMDHTDEVRRKCPEIRLVHVETLGGEGKSGDVEDEGVKGMDLERGGKVRENEKVSLKRYREASTRVFDVIFEVMRGYGNGWKVERASIDEAFLDVTEIVDRRVRKERNVDFEEMLRCSGSVLVGDKVDFGAESDRRLIVAAGIAKEVRNAVFEKCQYTCSAGISMNKMLAKFASATNKPNKQTLVCHGAVQELLEKIPLKKIRGFGGKLGQVIARLGVETVGDAQRLSEDVLAQSIGQSSAQWVYRIVRGMDDSEVVERERVKSLLAAKNFKAANSFSGLDKWLSILADELDERIAFEETHHRRDPRTLSLTFRCRSRPKGEFLSSTRSRPMPKAAEGTRGRLLKETALEILKANVGSSGKVSALYFPVSFLGLTATNFNDRADEESAITRFFQQKSDSASGGQKEESERILEDGISPTANGRKRSLDGSSAGNHCGASFNTVEELDLERKRRRQENNDLQFALKIQRQQGSRIPKSTTDKKPARKKVKGSNSQSIASFFKPKVRLK